MGMGVALSKEAEECIWSGSSAFSCMRIHLASKLLNDARVLLHSLYYILSNATESVEGAWSYTQGLTVAIEQQQYRVYLQTIRWVRFWSFPT